MAEYIVEEPSNRSASWRVHERIVRCRDCEWFDYDICACKRRPLHMAVEPDGFCAWGKRRVVDE